MKKIGLIAGLATMVTVGGVFAAWQYGGYATIDDDKTVSIEVEETVNDKDGFSGTVASTLAITFDQGGDADGYTATVDGNPLALSYNNSTGVPVSVNVTLTATFGGEGLTTFDDYVGVEYVEDEIEKLSVASQTLPVGTATLELMNATKLSEILNTESSADKGTIVNATQAGKFIEAAKKTTLTIGVVVTYN